MSPLEQLKRRNLAEAAAATRQDSEKVNDESGESDREKKDGPGVARARKQTAVEVRKVVRKVVRKAIQIAELISDADTEESVRVIREAKEATFRLWSKETKGLIFVPDHKTRLAAVTLELAYKEGTPVARSVSVNADADEGGSLRRALGSPALRRHLQAMLEGASVVEAEVIQETGSEKPCSTSE